MGGVVKACQQHQRQSTKKMYTAMEAMLEEGLHSDLRVEVQTDFAMAHRSVLASMSPVFKSMFNVGTAAGDQQASEGPTVIKLEEITSTKALRAFLRLMYLGTLDTESISWEHGLEILAASHKYQLPLVKAIVAKALEDMLTVENCLRILEAADMYEAGLMRKCRTFVEKNFREVVLTEAFEDLAARKPSLLVGLVRNKMECSVPRKIYTFIASKFSATSAKV